MKPLFSLLCSLVLFATPLGSVAQTMTLSSKAQVVTASRLLGVAEKTVHALINDPDRQVRPDTRLTDQQVPAGKVTIEAQAAQYNPTYIAIPLTIFVDGKEVRTIYAGYRIITYVHTAVAARDLPQGTVLTADDVTLGRVAFNGRAPIDVASLIGRKINVQVAHGMPIFMEQTRINQVVTAGQPVVYILHDGPVVVSADVIARTGGGLGQSVAVYNPQTRKELSGIVTAPGTVEYTLPGDATE